MKKIISCVLSLSMLCSSMVTMTAKAEPAEVETMTETSVVFKHQNVVGSQTCYSGDELNEQTITDVPNVYQGMRINQPIFKAELGSSAASQSYTVKQELKDGTVIKTDTVTADENGAVTFSHTRNCEMIEISDGNNIVASLGMEKTYTNGVAILSAPMSYQIYQRDDNDKATITISGIVSTATSVSVQIDNGAAEDVTLAESAFTYTKELNTGLHTIKVTSNEGDVATYEKVGVGDIWVAAGQSNMTDMGAITDNFAPDTDDPINENMHIIYAEDCTWQQMSHPAGEGRFFKTGTRTSPVTSFAREIAESEEVPVGIVQSSVGGTYTYQWVDGIKSDGNSGYLMNALKSCFDKMPSHNVKGILWYQGCNDATDEGLVYNYKINQGKVFTALRDFFGADVPIITTQLNDANQDDAKNVGYYDAWSYVKDIQRQNEDLYDNVYVVGTSELELGDTIHNSAASNLKVGAKWANVAKNVVYGDTSVNFRQPTIDTAKVTGDNEITLTFKNTDGLKLATGTKRIGITNVSGGGYKIELGDLTKEFTVRKGGDKALTSSNNGKGTELTITKAEIKDDTKVVLTTEEEIDDTVAVDCMYGKKFTPTLVDAATDESVLSFYNVIAAAQSSNANTEVQILKEYDFSKLSADTDDAPIKLWTNSPSSCTDTAIRDTGITLSISAGSGVWTTAKLITNAEKGKDLLAPNGAPEFDGTYLFIGSGGNATYTMKLPEQVEAGKYINFKYVRPKVSNNGSKDRTAENTHTITVGSETVDAVKACAKNDEAYVTSIYVPTATDTITFNFGQWGSLGIESIYITDAADVVTIENPDEVNLIYIGSDSNTVQYNGVVHNSVTYPINSNKATVYGSANEIEKPSYSVKNADGSTAAGVTINENGLLTVSNSASAGEVNVYAEYNGFSASTALELRNLGNADKVSIYGDELVSVGTEPVTKKYSAIPITDGVVLPARDTKWEIVGETNGTSIASDGTLTVPNTATAGVITIKATLTTSNVQSAEVSAIFPVTIRTSASSACPYNVQGLLLKNGETDLTNAAGIDGVIIEKTDDTSKDYVAVVKVFDENNNQIAYATAPLNDLVDGVQKVTLTSSFSKAATAKVYIAEAAANNEEFSSTKPYEIVKLEKSGSSLTKAVIVQNEETQTSADLIIAQYKDNMLKKTTVQNVTLDKGTNTVELKDVELLEGTEVKAMLWNSINEMKPLADTASEISESKNEVGAVVSDEIFVTAAGEYSNVPLVSDWITGTISGLGMGAGVISPQGAPYGVDPEVTDVGSALAYTYTYDDNYPAPTADNALWYKTAAYQAGCNIYARDGADWEKQALPIGNGYMGGMLFGRPDKDQIQFNEETFWAAGYRGTQTEVSSSTVNKNMGEGINGYMNAGNIFVDFNMPSGSVVNNYYRDVNLDESVAHVSYEYNGVKYNREYLASYPKEVLAFRYTADAANSISFDVKPVSAHPGEITVNNGEITIIGKLKDSEPYSSGGNVAWNQESDLEYCTKIKVIANGGTVTDGYNTVNVSGANDVTILVTAATDYDSDQFVLKADGSVDMTQTPYKSAQGVQAAIDKATTRMNGAAAMSYADLKAEHIADYKKQFDTVKFSLTDDDEVCTTPTNELQASYSSVIGTTSNSDGTTTVSYDETAYNNLNKHLEELHYNYARYLMISSSRSTTMPANLQGKWCQSVSEIWGSCYCININMEMNYWFVGGANLLDSGMSLVKWFNSQIPAGRVTAKNMYKVTPKSYTYENGKITFTESTDDKDDVFIMHTKQAINGTTDMTGSTSIQSAGNTAWLMYNLWDLYQTSGDKELLADDLYPIMRKAANFYTQYIYNNEKKTTTDTTKYPDGYYYTTWAGRSPEQGPTEEGIKYDLQLVAGMYDYTIKAAETLGVDADKVAAWKEIRNHLETPVELGDDGQIKEWSEETTYNTDASGNAIGDPVHRHISHLVGLYPGTLINRDTPELLEGAKIVLEKRGDDSTGWSCSNKFLLWARALDGDKALDLFRYQLAKKTYQNLFDFHDPFQIDGNFGSAAGVMELLMQSQTGDIYILPALPTAWDKGEISGIKAKNGAEVSIKWNNGKATEIKITPAVDGDITIGYEKDNALTLNGTDVTFTNNEYTITGAKAGTTYTFTAK